MSRKLTPEQMEAKEKRRLLAQQNMSNKRRNWEKNYSIYSDGEEYLIEDNYPTSTTRQSNANRISNQRNNKKGGSEMSNTIKQTTSRLPDPSQYLPINTSSRPPNSGAETSAITFSQLQGRQRIGAGSGNKQLIEAMSQQSEEITTAGVLGRKQTPGQIQAEAKANALKKAEAQENPVDSSLQESKTGVSFSSPMDMDSLASKFARFGYFYITHLLGISFFALLSTPAYLTGVILTPPFLGALFICELFFTQILINKDE